MKAEKTYSRIAEASFAQKRLWFLDKLLSGSAAYNVPLAFRLIGNLDKVALEKAFNEIIRRHEVLRTTFIAINDIPHQRVFSHDPFQLTVKQLNPGADLQALLTEEIVRPFSLEHGPLLRVKLYQTDDTTYVLLITQHHIITDGWSLGILGEELSVLYKAFVSGQTSPLPEVTFQYADYSKWQQEQLTGKLLQEQLNFWKNHLGTNKFVLDLPSDRPRPEFPTYRGKLNSYMFPAELLEQIAYFARKNQATPYMVLLSAFYTLLYRYTANEDIVVGSPISNRMRIEVERLLGFFVNTLPLRARINPHETFQDLLKQVRETALLAYSNQDLPFEKLVEELQPTRTVSHNPVFQVTLGLNRGIRPNPELPGIEIEEIAVDRASVPFDLHLSLTTHRKGLEVEIEYSTDLFDGDRIDRMAQHFRNIIEAVLKNPQQKIGFLPLLTDSERGRILYDWNQTRRDYPSSFCVHEVFQQQVEESPDATALVFQDQTLTYRQLNDAANNLAARLLEAGVKPGEIIGLYVDRSFEMIIGLLAILKAGCAYLPLDPALPDQRLSFTALDAGVRIILVQSQERPALNTEAFQQMKINPVSLPDQRQFPDLQNRTTPESVCYVMYTSGSTGKPKGVCVPHKAVVRLVKNVNYVRIEKQDVFFQYAPLSFDASTFEIWGALLNGAILAIAPPGPLSLTELGQELKKQKVTILWLTSVLFNEMVDQRIEDLVNVRQILAGGEPLSVLHVGKASSHLKNSTLINGYGPTECTTFATYHVIREKDFSLNSIPIGKPITNAQIYILDRMLQPLPIGVPGEVFIGGAGVACGYLNEPERTAERFIPDPFADSPDARLYKTGDVGRWNRDGEMDFLGRMDDQVKIRGFRIEPGEIESTINQHPLVRQSEVLPHRSHQNLDHFLLAYVVSDQQVSPGEIKEFLLDRLPVYMIPSHIFILSQLPLNSNKKLDRDRLPVPDQIREISANSLSRPRNLLQSQLVGIWEKVLNRKSIGVHDNFFDLGGHSLLALKLFAEIEKQIGKNLPVVSLLAAQTIDKLSKIIEEEGYISRWSSLVPIQPDGNNPPLFLIHPVGGTVLRYRLLAKYLGQDQPVYGLQARGLDGKSVPFSSVEEMADSYIREIQSVQPGGPYRLGGYSFGGVVAFEIAQHLKRNGEDIDILALFDSVPPGNHRILRPLERMYSRVAANIQDFISDPRKKMKNVMNKVGTPGPTPHARKRPPAMRRRFRRVRQINEIAFTRYEPQSYSGPIHLFMAKEFANNRAYDVVALWKQFCAQLIVCEIPGNHGNITHEPNVQILAHQLKQHLLAFR